jgi:heme/copper-type cytochrome/quinol oxidase subunit 2
VAGRERHNMGALVEPAARERSCRLDERTEAANALNSLATLERSHSTIIMTTTTMMVMITTIIIIVVVVFVVVGLQL